MAKKVTSFGPNIGKADFGAHHPMVIAAALMVAGLTVKQKEPGANERDDLNELAIIERAGILLDYIAPTKDDSPSRG